MPLFGKLTFAVTGLRFFGAEGFFIGMLLGHFIFDRTKLMALLGRRLGMIDDNIRLLLPYKYYHYYNQIEGRFWGKVWGALLGGFLFGWPGFVFLFVLGHVVFDMPDCRRVRQAVHDFDNFWDAHWGKITGAVVGFVCRSDIILFCGVIIGFFADYVRIENASLLPWRKVCHFWQSLNPLRLWKYSHQARHRAYIRAMAGLAAKTAKADGAVNEHEIRAFKRLFEISDDESPKISRIFNEAKKSAKGFEPFCRQLQRKKKKKLELKEEIIDGLFQIACADGEPKQEELDFLAKAAAEIGLPAGNYEMVKKLYMPKAKDKKLQKCYDILGVLCTAADEDIRARWKTLIVRYHPDRLQAQGASEKEIRETTAKIAEINYAYQEVMKFRGVR